MSSGARMADAGSMAASHAFPASAAKSLVDGYCQDFVSLAASLAQTLEQMRMRGIPFDSTREALARTERGMRDLAEAIQDALSGRQSLPPDAPATPTQVPSAPSAPAAQPTAAASPMVAPAFPAPPSVLPPSALPPTAASGSAASAVPANPAEPKPAVPRTAIGPGPGARGEVRPGAQRATRRTPAPGGPTPAAPSSAASPTTAAPGGATVPPVPADAMASGAASALADAGDRPPVVRPAGSEEVQGLVGTSETMPLLSVFQFLNRVRKSGTLHVDADGELMTFEFVAGIIEFTTSSRAEPRERLGEILGAMFPMLRESVETFLQQNEPLLHSRRLGGVLVGKGIATNGQVMEALERQVLTRFRRATRATLAKYRFEEGERVPGDGRIRIRPFELMHQHRRPG